MKKLKVNATTSINFSDKQISLSDEIATRKRSIDFYALGMYLPNPDPVLKKQGKDITVYNELLSDGHLGGCVTSRKSGVKSLEWEIDRGKSKSHQAKLIEDVFKNLDLDRIVGEILNAPLFGYQVLEVLWERVGNYILPKDVVGKPQEWFVFSEDNELKFRTRENYNGESLPERKFLLATYEATYKNPYGFPVLSRCFWPVTFKKGGLKFWVIFTEKYGMPFLIGKHPRGTGKTDTDRLAEMLEQMVQDAIAVIPDDSSVEIQEAGGKSASADIYAKLLEFCKAEVSIAILGQNLTTEVKEGSYAASQSHMKVRGDIITADAKLVQKTLNQLIRWICDLNFNMSNSSYPSYSLYEQEDVDKALAERDEILSRQGVRLSKNYYMREYGFEAGDIEAVNQFPQPVGPQFIEPSSVITREAKQSQFTPEQQALEDLKETATEDWEEMLKPMVEPIMQMIEESSTIEEVKAKIMEAYGIMDDLKVSDILARAIFNADVWGRLNAGS